jgi:uncharacterized protein (DUF2235 family)
MTEHEAGPKNIIICADGTGNAGGRKRGTNVWRIREAVLKPNGTDAFKQVVIYEDGVGSETNRPMQILGGAFGAGISKDLESLYGRLVRHFVPGDNIFVFGFSRGSFTARTLVNMLYWCGIADRHRKDKSLRHPEGVDEIAKQAVLAYKHRRNGKAETFRNEFGLAHPESKESAVSSDNGNSSGNEKGRFPIRFLGVWDTVDAVVLPFDNVTQGLLKANELTSRIGVSFPGTLLNFRQSKILFDELDDDIHEYVQHACHAISLDDERLTFSPVLMREYAYDPLQKKAIRKDGSKFLDTDESRSINQVWFSGVHANVGGGYPKDHLSHVSLEWMMRHAWNHGLVFCPEKWKEYTNEIDELGKLYNSRAGASAFYRYQPRIVEDLWKNNALVDATTKKPNFQEGSKSESWEIMPTIHASVLRRIKSSSLDYAPIGIPKYDKYKVGGNPPIAHDSSMASKDLKSRVDELFEKQAPRDEPTLETINEPSPVTESTEGSREHETTPKTEPNNRYRVQSAILGLVSLRRVLYYSFFIWLLFALYFSLALSPPLNPVHLASESWLAIVFAGVALVAKIVEGISRPKKATSSVNFAYLISKQLFSVAVYGAALTYFRTTLLSVLLWATPQMIAPFIIGIVGTPLRFLVFGLVLYVLLELRNSNGHGIRELSVYGWRRALPEEAHGGHEPHQPDPPRAYDEDNEQGKGLSAWLGRLLTQHWLGTRVRTGMELVVVPFVGIAILFFIVITIVWHETSNWFLDRSIDPTPIKYAFQAANDEQLMTPPLSNKWSKHDFVLTEVSFNTAHVSATNYLVEKGQVYRLKLTRGEGPWKDGNTVLPNEKNAVVTNENKAQELGHILKVDSKEKYFQLMGAIGKATAKPFPIREDTDFVASDTGQLFLFVNDVAPFLSNNVGTARIRIEAAGRPDYP